MIMQAFLLDSHFCFCGMNYAEYLLYSSEIQLWGWVTKEMTRQDMNSPRKKYFEHVGAIGPFFWGGPKLFGTF